MGLKDDYIKALIKEMKLQTDYLNGEAISTIYFGGGTPSQLSRGDFELLFNAIYENFQIEDNPEITIEANPDDMTLSYINGLKQLPFNRVSIGIQSFNDADLLFLRRRHNKEQAIRAVRSCQEAGLANISIDLMYGLPDQQIAQWEENINQAALLNVPHISAYHLIYEESTLLYRMLQERKINQIEEDISLEMFSLLIDRLAEKGYQQYEISNFSKPGYISKHNSSYWKGVRYLGLGASAHSFDGESRSWNVSSIEKYIKGITAGYPDKEKEILDKQIRYNEYIITRMRTIWGVNLEEVRQLFGEDYFNYAHDRINLFVKKGLIVEKNEHFCLAKSGIFISDSIMSDLLKV